MSRKIIGVTVGTPISPESLRQKMNIEQTIEDYLEANPIEETDPTVPDWAKQPEKPKYTAEEVGALDAAELPEAINAALAQAKESGEFKGDKGDPYTLTDADKETIKNAVIAALPVYDGEAVEI